MVILLNFEAQYLLGKRREYDWVDRSLPICCIILCLRFNIQLSQLTLPPSNTIRLDPTWMETHFIPVKSLLSQTKLRFDLYDHHEHIRRHTLLGSGILDYSCLNGTGMENWQHSGVRVLLRKDEVGVEGGLGKDKGEVLCDLSFYETEEEVRKRRLKEMEEEERKRKEQGISEQEHASQKKRRSIFGAPGQ